MTLHIWPASDDLLEITGDHGRAEADVKCYELHSIRIEETGSDRGALFALVFEPTFGGWSLTRVAGTLAGSRSTRGAVSGEAHCPHPNDPAYTLEVDGQARVWFDGEELELR